MGILVYPRIHRDAGGWNPKGETRRITLAGALDGIRVIDFGQYIAGPLAGMLLADQGADVIKIDPPGGPTWKTPANSTWSRSKRSILLDLKQPEDLALISIDQQRLKIFLYS